MENENIILSGHLKIIDPITKEILVDKSNSINFETMSVAIVQSLISGPLNASTYSQTGFVYSLAFGNGGTTVSSSGIITYNPPNTIGTAAALYNQTYSKIINNNFSADTDSTDNNITYDHVPGKAYTDMVISCMLNYGEPANQIAFDNSNNINSQYAFDEMGIVSSSGQLLTHVIFTPVLKSANRLLNITYTIRISTLSSLAA
jgi:hypothetical protein